MGKTPLHNDESSRFRGKIRHYHRKGSGDQSWDHWIDADTGGRPKRNWAKIILAILGLLALVAIGIGLWIEMS